MYAPIPEHPLASSFMKLSFLFPLRRPQGNFAEVSVERSLPLFSLNTLGSLVTSVMMYAVGNVSEVKPNKDPS